MTAALNSPPEFPMAVNLLEQAIERARPLLSDRRKSTNQRVRILWAAAKRARDLGSSDVVHAAFGALAVQTNLIDSRGWWTGTDVRPSVRRYGLDDVDHVITWALRGWNPFEQGSLK